MGRWGGWGGVPRAGGERTERHCLQDAKSPDEKAQWFNFHGQIDNDCLSWPANLRHAAGVSRNTGPVRSLVSLTRTRRGLPPTSTQSPPPLPLWLDFRQRRFIWFSTALLPPR